MLLRTLLVAAAAAAARASPIPTTVTACETELLKDCPNWPSGTAKECAVCARAHAVDLRFHNCSTAAVTALCRTAGKGPTPGPPPPPSPPGPPGPAGDPCAKQLVADGCLPGSTAACETCAASHRADLGKAGCDEQEVVELCKGGPNPGPPPGPPGTAMGLVLLQPPPGQGGLCLDGSPAGFYYGNSTAVNTSGIWEIYLDGGGACYCSNPSGVPTPQCPSGADCTKRAKGQDGSSKDWSQTLKGSQCKVCSSDDWSQGLTDAHHVTIPYCTGDVHSGTRTTTSKDTFGLYFDGHLNFGLIVDELMAKYGLVDGPNTKILLNGGSAGGAGTFLNADYMSTRFPRSTVKAAPNAGYFFPGDPASLPKGNGIPLDYADWTAGPPYNLHHPANGDRWNLYAGGEQNSPSMKKCKHFYNTTLGPDSLFFCGSVSNLYPFISTPILTVENEYDHNQLFTQMGVPAGPPFLPKTKEYIARYGALMRNSTRQISENTAKPSDGIFLASCLDHGMGTGTVLKASDGRMVGYQEVLADWFFGQGKFTSHRLVDSCSTADGLPCNPTCTHKSPGSY